MLDKDAFPQKGSRRQSVGSHTGLKLVGLKPTDEHPHLAVYVLNRSNEVLQTSKVDAKGHFELDPEAVADSRFIAIGPVVSNFQDLDREKLLIYQTQQFLEDLKVSPNLEIPPQIWKQWWFVTLCVTGSVSHCYPYPWLISELKTQAIVPLGLSEIKMESTATVKPAVSNLAIAKNVVSRFPFERCETVCDGLVEVYRRTCCCEPWIILDPRIPVLIKNLEDLVKRVPVKWPPIPEPDPAPFSENILFKGGTLNEMALYASRDLTAIRSLPVTEQAAYIQARPYLWRWFCSCGPAKKVAQGFIHPDGKFSICWEELPSFIPFNCYDEYAYVVKQSINGQSETIYDGLAADKWFKYEDDASLVSYNPLAQGCRHNDFPGGEGAFVLLQDIGLTGSYRLQTPDATGWDRVASPVYNDGLVDTVVNPLAAKGAYKNRNWGGTLYLRYHFSEPMKGVGAKYYRISVSASDSSGNPVGPRTYLSDGISWKKYVTIGSDIYVQSDVLGPFSQGGENNLFLIPYDADADWQSGQYHGYLDTTMFANGRFLLTVEVFNAAGQRLRPTGVPGAGLDAAFTFRRWYQEIGPTANVPFAALTHMLWWDNRTAIADIIDLRKDGIPSTAECQFLEGVGDSTFSVGYVAYHPEPMFLLNHSLWWRRGLGGPTGYLVNASPDNVGPAEGVSPTNKFSDMLGTEAKCSFSLNLYVNVKTTNGIGTLDGLDAWDYAAFALEIS